ncbi:hypothetical protein B0I35DRAFT_477835 [Stachybotrys elegans]|uniref:Uncharacterized protein n=1 Tax=Stachybotrys elegans TaxID=80388 RepID=A0A8K0SQR5_9HYPO|nr:hypothetical protein B0I35DRAFT_477835 [Stachybotrys elegans]
MSSRDNTKEEPMPASIINHKSSNSSINNRPPTANTGALPSEQQQQQQQQQQQPAETTASPAPASPGDDNDDDESKPPFEPLFTLLTNVTRNSTVHPRVRYVFSDDDAASVLAAEEGSTARAVIIDLAAATPAEEDEGSGGAGAGGGARWRIAGASSLSGDFAVTDASLAAQQDGALMLRVDGVERERLPEEEEGGGGGGTEDVEGLMEEFRRRLGVLRMVVKEGERSDEEEDKEE